MTQAPTVAWLGTGLMGAPMATRLAQKGLSVRVWNRTRQEAEALLPEGVEVASTPQSAVAPAEVVFTMLSDYAATRGVLEGLEVHDKTVVQMATIAPSESRRLATLVESKGGRYLEAPVLGSIPEAKGGRLIIMVGGAREDFERSLPHPRRRDPPDRRGGKAAALKLALNQLIATLTAAFATSLVYVQKSGLDVETFMAILRKSALYAPTFDKKWPRMLAHD